MNTVDRAEIQQFAKDSDHWWDENGPFAPLHRMNPVRMCYIRAQIEAHFDAPPLTPPPAGGKKRETFQGGSLKPFKGLKILDIGCGGGLICEPMTRLGGSVTGIDADENAIAIASAHAYEAGLDVKYEATTSEQHLSSCPRRRASGNFSKGPDPRLRGGDSEGMYDIVLALEIVEHVADVDLFVQSCVDLCKPGGLLIFSTLNRTPKSFALGIVAAEYVLRWVPRGTHSWKKFIKPSELSRALRKHGAEAQNISGLIYNPLEGDFTLSANDLDVNYFLSAKR